MKPHEYLALTILVAIFTVPLYVHYRMEKNARLHMIRLRLRGKQCECSNCVKNGRA